MQTGVVVHPLDMEHFGWTTGGIVQMDSNKLNEVKLVNNMLSAFMQVEPPQTAPQLNENGNGSNDASSNQTSYHNLLASFILFVCTFYFLLLFVIYLHFLFFIIYLFYLLSFFYILRQPLAYARVFSSPTVPRGHISIPRFFRWTYPGLCIHERIWLVYLPALNIIITKLIFLCSASMPAPHTLPIVRFTSITLRPVVWWGKQKESPAANRSIIMEALKIFESPHIAQSAKSAFATWVRSKIEKDGQPRVPLANGSIIELSLDESGTTMDVSIHFDVDEPNQDLNPNNMCIPSMYYAKQHVTQTPH